jgi:hypothetical protein
MINLLTAFVGLPGAGKTKWMEKMLPEKHFFPENL